MESDPASEARTPTKPIELNQVQRLTAGTVGLASLAVAVVATFSEGDGGAIVAFVAFGGVSLLLGLVGQLPRSIKWGDGAIDFSEREKIERHAVDQTVDELQPTAPALSRAASSAVAASPDGSSAAALRLAEHAMFEGEVIRELVAAARAIGASYSLESEGQRPRWDLTASLDERRVHVDVRLRLSRSQAAKMRAQVGELDPSDCLLIVARDVEQGSMEALVNGTSTVALVRWSGDPTTATRYFTSLLLGND